MRSTGQNNGQAKAAWPLLFCDPHQDSSPPSLGAQYHPRSDRRALLTARNEYDLLVGMLVADCVERGILYFSEVWTRPDGIRRSRMLSNHELLKVIPLAIGMAIIVSVAVPLQSLRAQMGGGGMG